MSLFNSSKSATSSSTSTKDTTLTQTDNRTGGNSAVFGGNVSLNPMDSPGSTFNVSTTDQGAILAGKDAVAEALNFASASQAGIKSVASDSISQAYDLANSARQSETSGAINNVLKYGAIILVVGIIGWAVVKSK